VFTTEKGKLLKITKNHGYCVGDLALVSFDAEVSGLLLFFYVKIILGGSNGQKREFSRFFYVYAVNLPF